MSDRFYSATPITGERVTLDGPEAHHLLHVLRAEVGRRVTLWDGSGTEFVAEVTACRRQAAELRILEKRTVDRELPFSLAVGVALPKGERQKWLVEKLTELGVTTLVPLATERGVAQPTGGAQDRLGRWVIEASKQCGRNRLMQIQTPLTWQEWIVTDDDAAEARRLLAHPGGRPLVELDLAAARPTRLAIGPEGGLTDGEAAAAIAAGWHAVDLGPRILRVETAAVALAAAVVLRAHHPPG
jgi:16S rRNA (uracil1498-N3)-methyltransferase